MKRKENGVTVLSGEIRKIHYTESRESVYITVADGPVAEFRNGKTKRADNASKLRLNVGEQVIISGVMKEESATTMFGYEIMREGKVSAGNTAIIRGEIGSVSDIPNGTIVSIAKNNIRIYDRKPHVGDIITCLCRRGADSCDVCGQWNHNKCAACKKYNHMYEAVSVA